MGTRGAYGFRTNGQDKLTYNHFDSYPNGLGETVFKFIVDNLPDLPSIAESMKLVTEQSVPTPEQIAECKKANIFNANVDDGSDQNWYCLLRGAEGEPQAWADGLRTMVDSQAFLQDSLFCEWAYVINIDEGVLEVYRGFNHDTKAAGRYADNICPEYLEKPSSQDNPFCGVRLVNRMRLDTLKRMGCKRFVARVKYAANGPE